MTTKPKPKRVPRVMWAIVLALATSCSTIDPDAEAQARAEAYAIDPPDVVCNECGLTVQKGRDERPTKHLVKCAKSKTGFRNCEQSK